MKKETENKIQAVIVFAVVTVILWAVWTLVTYPKSDWIMYKKQDILYFQKENCPYHDWGYPPEIKDKMREYCRALYFKENYGTQDLDKISF